jgi:hypothetical protein
MTSEPECGPGHPENHKCHSGGDTRVGHTPLAAQPSRQWAAADVARNAEKHPSHALGEFMAASTAPVWAVDGGCRVVQFVE